MDTSSPFLDITPMADDAMYAQFVEAVIEDDGVDCVFVAVVPHAVSLKTVPETCRDPGRPGAASSWRSRAAHAKPMVVSVNAGRHYADFVAVLEEGGLPVYPDIRSAITSLDTFVSYCVGRKVPGGAQRLLTRPWRCSSSWTGTGTRSARRRARSATATPGSSTWSCTSTSSIPAGRLYLQKRSMSKDTNPGRWDTSVGGHVSAGEEVTDALLREAREELGIDAAGAAFLYSWLSEGTSNRSSLNATPWKPISPSIPTR